MSSKTSPKINRRKFLTLAGATLGVSAAACCGLGAAGTYSPHVELTKNHYQGENEMNNRILVAYASKVGSTGEVASFIGKTLSSNGATVDVQPIEKVTDVNVYQAVVVGSAVRAGQWISAATDFVKTNQSYLSRTPTAYFTCCMTLHEDTEANRQKAVGFMAPVCDLVTPVDMAAFAGKMDYSKISFFERFMVTKVFSTPEGDFRNWDAIRAWTNGLQPTLVGV
jgi:menaquinone-dependent protoporphyrinogen oxidase